jgi:hypothetical protein
VGASPRSASPDLALPDTGASIHKRVPIVGRCFSPFLPRNLRLPFDPAMSEWQPTVLLWQTSVTRHRIRLVIKHPPRASGLAQIVAQQPENAVASASFSSIRIEWSASG